MTHADKLTAVDRRALSPLYWSYVNPYGTFRLDMGRLDLWTADRGTARTATRPMSDPPGPEASSPRGQLRKH